MTNQRDPVRDRNNRNMNIRREDGSWSLMPIVLGLALLLGLGYFVMNSMTIDRGPNVQRTDAPSTTTVPRTTPTAPK
jgi:hypothetical protein